MYVAYCTCSDPSMLMAGHSVQVGYYMYMLSRVKRTAYFRGHRINSHMTVVFRRSHAFSCCWLQQDDYLQEWGSVSYTRGITVISVKYLTACNQLARSLTGSSIADLWAFIPLITDYFIDRQWGNWWSVSASLLSRLVRIHVHVGESMDTTTLVNCQMQLRSPLMVGGS